MSILTKLKRAVTSSTARPLDAYSDLDAPITGYVFSNDNGDLCTLIHIGGNREQPIGEIFVRKMQAFAVNIEPFLQERRHVIHASGEFDPSRVRIKNELETIWRPNKEAAKRMGLDLEWLYDKKIDKLTQYCAATSSFLAVWTLHKGAHDSKAYSGALREEALGNYSQETWNTHLGFLDSVRSALNRAGIVNHSMNLYRAIAEIRRMFNYEETPPNWKPLLKPSDNPVMRTDGKHVLYLPPALKYQVTPGKVEAIDFDTCVIGSRTYKAFDIKYFPARPTTFESLLYRAAEKRLPFRYSLRIAGGPSLRYHDVMNVISIGKEKKAYQALKATQQAEHTVVAAQASIATWTDEHEAPNDGDRARLLSERGLGLRYVVKAWGGAEIDSKGTDPIDQVANTIPGFRFPNTADASFPPLFGVAPLAPLYKTARIWDKMANSIYRNGLGEIIPVKRFSKEQPYNMTLIQGEPGSGKSNLINDMILAIATDPAANNLPLIGVVDIKPSSFGALRLIKEALPESKRHQVQMITLTNTPEHAINPNDTLYGARYPTQAQARMQKAFWSIHCQPIHAKTVLDEVSRTIDAILAAAYHACSDEEDNSSAKQYTKGDHPVLDNWLAEERYEPDDRTTYWEIFDYFNDQNKPDKAAFVQTLAVPNLKDMIMVARDQRVVSATAGLMINNQPANEYVSNLLVALAEKYPVFSNPSRLNAGDARVISIDIRHMVKGKGAEEAQLAAATYTLAMHVVTQNFRITEEDLKGIHPRYHPFLKKRIADYSQSTRTAIFDEMHKMSTGGDTPFADMVKQEIITNIREEARAEKIEYIIASQLPDEFKGQWKELYQTALILNTSEGDAANNTVKMYDLPKEMAQVISSLGKPTRDGSAFLMITKSSRGRFVQKCFNTLPAEQLWGTTTSHDDVLVKELMIKRVGSLGRALEILSFAFGPSAESKRDQMILEGTAGKEGENTNLTERLVDYALKIYETNRH